jgi:small subunit ribosomal protein S20
MAARHKSALKAHRQNVVRREANRNMRSRLRGALRSIRTAIDNGDPTAIKGALRDTISLVDKMAGKGVIHRNAAARYKARLSKRVTKRTAASAA